MTAILTWLGRHARIVLAAAVVAGIAMPALGDRLVPAFPVMVAGMLAAAMVRLELRAVLAQIRRPLPVLATLALLLVALPVAVHALTGLLGLPPLLRLGILLAAVAPPIASSANLAFILGIDAGFTLSTTVIATFAAPVLAPILVEAIAGVRLDDDVAAVLLRLALIVGGAALAAAAVRAVVPKTRIDAHAAVLDGIATLLMVVFAFAVMGAVGEAVASGAWGALAGTLAAVLAANFGLQAATAATLTAVAERRRAGARLDRRRSLAIGLMAGNRNLALMVAALPPDQREALLLFLAVFQLPIYFTPLVVTPVYRRVLGGTA